MVSLTLDARSPSISLDHQSDQPLMVQLFIQARWEQLALVMSKTIQAS